MPIIGIMRYGSNDDFWFVAESCDNRIYQNVTVYEIYPDAGAPQVDATKYPSAILEREDKILSLPNGQTVFDSNRYGREPIQLFEIDGETYKRIFCHEYDSDFGSVSSSVMSVGVPVQKDVFDSWVEAVRFVREQCPLEPPYLEYLELVKAARKNGFNRSEVNYPT